MAVFKDPQNFLSFHALLESSSSFAADMAVYLAELATTATGSTPAPTPYSVP
jgi:hypothetical protein